MAGEATQIRREFEARYNVDFTIPSVIVIYKSLSAAIAKAYTDDLPDEAAAMTSLRNSCESGGDRR